MPPVFDGTEVDAITMDGIVLDNLIIDGTEVWKGFGTHELTVNANGNGFKRFYFGSISPDTVAGTYRLDQVNGGYRYDAWRVYLTVSGLSAGDGTLTVTFENGLTGSCPNTNNFVDQDICDYLAANAGNTIPIEFTVTV